MYIDGPVHYTAQLPFLITSFLLQPSQKKKVEQISSYKRNGKTYNSRYSLVVTHLTTNRPVRSLSMPERTGWPVFCDLWSYVPGEGFILYIYFENHFLEPPKILFELEFAFWLDSSNLLQKDRLNNDAVDGPTVCTFRISRTRT